MQVLCFFDPAILHPQHPVCLRRKPLVVGDIHNGLVLLCGCQNFLWLCPLGVSSRGFLNFSIAFLFLRAPARKWI